MPDVFNRDLKIMQPYAQRLISRRTAIEQLGLVKDVDAEISLIEAEENTRYLRNAE